MDPALRATTEELIRHIYLNHDRFVEKFLPKLRQKVLQEYHENPLIRKYQADILTASDDRRQDLYQDRYGKKLETPKWKINLQDPFIKRKTSYVSFSSFKTHESSMESKISDSFNSKSYQSSINSELKNNGAKLGTTLFRLEQRKQMDKTKNKEGNDTKENSDRPSSDKNIELHLTSPSPPLFQSLQPDCNRTTFSQNILHPTINNLSFVQKEQKRNSNLCQPNSNRGKESLGKTLQAGYTRSPIPVTQQPREHYLKRLSRGLVLDVNQLNENTNSPLLMNLSNKTPPAWLNTAGYTTYKKNNQVEQTTWTKLDGSGVGDRPEKTQFPNINTGLYVLIFMPYLPYLYIKAPYSTGLKFRKNANAIDNLFCSHDIFR